MLSSARAVFGDAQRKTSKDEHFLYYFVQKISSHISSYQKLCGFSVEVTDSWVLMFIGLDANYIQAVPPLPPPPCLILI